MLSRRCKEIAAGVRTEIPDVEKGSRERKRKSDRETDSQPDRQSAGQKVREIDRQK